MDVKKMKNDDRVEYQTKFRLVQMLIYDTIDPFPETSDYGEWQEVYEKMHEHLSDALENIDDALSCLSELKEEQA